MKRIIEISLTAPLGTRDWRNRPASSRDWPQRSTFREEYGTRRPDPDYDTSRGTVSGPAYFDYSVISGDRMVPVIVTMQL